MIVWSLFIRKILMKVFVILLAQKLRHQKQIYDIHPIRKFWESASKTQKKFVCFVENYTTVKQWFTVARGV